MLKSQKGKDILFYKGYRYRRDRVTSASESWRCCNRFCKGRLLCKNEEKEERSPHNHAPAPALEEVNLARNRIRELATITPLKPRSIIQTASSEVKSAEASVELPSYDANRKAIKRQRIRNNTLEIDLMENLADLQTSKGVTFLLWDSREDNDNQCRIILFGTMANLDLLVEFHNWSVDGTFNVAPQLLLMQLFTIHIIVENKAVPVVFAVLENKQASSYLRLINKLKELNPNLKPNSVLADFEIACFASFKQLFPDANIVGCFFHLTQNLWRKIQKLGLVDRYRFSEKFRMQCKMLAALAFVPVKDVQFSLEIISESFDPEIRPLLDYWERTYVGKRLEKVLPKFEIKMWNVYDRIHQNLPTTNNSLEAWHLSFQKSLDCFNPSLQSLCQQMLKEQDTTEIFVLRYRTGFRQNQGHSKYAQQKQRMKNLLSEYTFRNVEQHLRSVTYNLVL